jgi:predicted AAA+ superfamily ATPase
MPQRAAQRAPDSAALDAMNSVLDASSEPIAVSKLKSILKGPLRRSEAEVVTLLEAERAAGRVFRYAPYSSKSVRYGRQPPEVYARQLALAALQRKCQTLRDIERSASSRLKDYAAADWQRLVEHLVAEKQVFVIPGPTARSAVRYSLRPPDPRDYLRSLVAGWRKKLDQIAGRGATFGV